MAQETKNVFISHIHEDDDGLGKLRSLLKDYGMTIWEYSIGKDNPDNAHSESYIKSEILAPRIRRSNTLAVYISPETKDSPWVDWEVEYAHKQDKRIVGVRAHDESGCDVPEALEKYADAIVGWASNRIVDAIIGNSLEYTMMRPIAVEAREGYHIWLRYSDGVEGEIDLSHLAGRGVFTAWDSRTFFESVRIEDHGAVAWGEELELCPDALYLQLSGKSVMEVMSDTLVSVENA